MSKGLASLAGVGDAELKDALEEANLPVLLAIIEQFQGNASSLVEGQLPSMASIAGDEKMSEEVCSAVRSTAFELLKSVRDGGVGLAEKLTTSDMARAASFCIGGKLEDEFVPMMLEDMGFTDSALDRIGWSSTDRPTSADNFKVIIIGSGLSGIAAAIHLERLGIPYTLFEKNPAVGGTWYENNYPDCGVDTPNHFYSYSFAPNDDWAAYYSKRDELFKYITNVAEKFEVTPNIQFSSEVVSASYNESTHQWEVEVKTADGQLELHKSNVVIGAVGQVNRPAIPEFPGADTFSGEQFHSTYWPSDFDPAGKRIGIIGTGASAMQFAPAIASEAGEISIFQRTPHWIRMLPDYHYEVSDGKKWLLRHVPFYRNWYRMRLYWSYGDTLLETLKVDSEWPHQDRSINALNDRFRQTYVNNIETALQGRKDLIEKVVPQYPLFAKRMLIDNHWCDMLLRDNVELLTTGVESVDENGIVGADGSYTEVDTIIYATGFNALKFLWPISIVGRDNRSLSDEWGDDARAYLGMTAPMFPNFFVMYGPNTNLAHGGSIFFHAECQARYITQCVVKMIETGSSEMETRSESFESYTNAVDQEHAKLIWNNTAVGEWFKNSAGRVVGVTPWRLVDYWHMTHEPNWSDYVWNTPMGHESDKTQFGAG